MNFSESNDYPIEKLNLINKPEIVTELPNLPDLIEENNKQYFEKQQKLLKKLADEAYNGNIEEAKKHYNEWIQKKSKESLEKSKVLNYDDLI